VSARVLVAGVGNELFGDDGFGVAVVNRLASRPRVDGVVFMNAGIRGFDLTSALLDGYDAAVLVDTATRGGAPGTLYLLEPRVADVLGEATFDIDVDPHRLEPSRVLALANAVGAKLACLRVVACEPTPTWEMSDILSPPVEAAVEPAATLVGEIVLDMLAGNGSHA
jgi:hydrogenase maturation protease